MKRLFVRIGAVGLLFYASCGGRTTLVDLSEQDAGEGGVGGTTGGAGGKGGKGGKGGVGGTSGGVGGGVGGVGVGGVTGGVGGATGGVGGATGGGPAGTGGISACQIDPCRNGGVCYDVNGGWACQCPAGTYGADCSGNVNDCYSNPCVNGDCEDHIGGFTCHCDNGFTGELCDIPVPGDCSPNPCLNGGKCLDQPNGFRCDCAEGFHGRLCEVQRDPCQPNPCLNGGSCTARMNDFACTCPAGFSGERCETVVGDTCPSPNPCQNGGTCVVTGGGDVACMCPPGFSVPFCQCRDGDLPLGDGSCGLRTVCGRPVPEAFGSGDCSSNTGEFADWWCQLGGYARAASYTTLTSGVLNSHYYAGGAEEVLSACDQALGPITYGYNSDCTGVRDLACTGTVTNALRNVLMVCGGSTRDPRTFIPAGSNLTFANGCAPLANTQALMVARSGRSLIDASLLRPYLHAGGIVISEYGISHELWSQVFPDVPQSNLQYGSCLDNVPTVFQYSPTDPFWIDNTFTPIPTAQTGCGYSVAHFPHIVPLAGWDASSVGLGYRNVGQGRFWAADFDWQDQDQNGPTLPALLGYMVTHRR